MMKMMKMMTMMVGRICECDAWDGVLGERSELHEHVEAGCKHLFFLSMLLFSFLAALR